MPVNPHKLRCTHTTRAGAPCRAWSVHGTDPPTCSAHAGRNAGACPDGGRAGAPSGNQNARTHGFYAKAFDPEELADIKHHAENLGIDDEIEATRISFRRILTAVRDFDNGNKHPETYARFLGLVLEAARTIARLLRVERALSGQAADGIAGAIGQAIDELCKDWDIDL